MHSSNPKFGASKIVAPICWFLFGESALFEFANSCAPWWAVAIATLCDLLRYIHVIICPSLPTILLILPTNPVEACAKGAIFIHCRRPHKISMHTVAICRGTMPFETCHKHTKEALTLQDVLTYRQIKSYSHQTASGNVCITMASLCVQRLSLSHMMA